MNPMVILHSHNPERIEIRARPLPRRRAASAVEFAVVSLVLFPMVLGIIEVGRALMVIHMLSCASQRGCRCAIIEGHANSDVLPVVENTAAAGGVTVYDSNVTVQVNNTTADCNTANSGDEITVIVGVPVSQITWVPCMQHLVGNLSAQYTLTRE
jgi:Flp pilus assembly protein TadG